MEDDMRIGWATVLAIGIASCLSWPVAAQDWDKRTIEKMLKDGAKKMTSANPEEREEGAGYILGYITCAYRAQYQPIMVKALKDTNPKVRNTAAQTLEKIQAVDAIPDLLLLLDDPVNDVAVRAAYAIGGFGTAGKSAEPGLKAARTRAQAAKRSMVAGTIDLALDEISGKRAPDRYKCP
jgi:HEAT repeat protein